MTDEELIIAYEADQKFRNLLPGTLAVRRRYLRKLSREVGLRNSRGTWVRRCLTCHREQGRRSRQKTKERAANNANG